ncbi:TonB-dependent receptor [Rhizosphaericola mali]|uniref:TonB-dependent receptor n=1 Tax=Rhizosphaericola mali TaxID=2545455 RepID=A0A5P2GE85_9BACT|nr:TonB-dependent receptor [Rhizosphaericola mali]QES89921.1 TonB-dependent receptor [Rhizosphaericola mali]
MQIRTKIFLFLGLCLFIFLHGNAQNIKDTVLVGKLLTSDAKAAEGVQISLPLLKRKVYSNDKGQFIIDHLIPGNYDIEITPEGFKSIKKSIVIRSDTNYFNLTLLLSTHDLEDVTIFTRMNKFNKKETDDIARMPLKNIENPQVYTVVPKELLQEQIVSDYNSAFKNIPGAGVPVVYNQGRSALLSRGFTTANLIRNSVSGFVYTNIDPANLERLEAIKGPSGTLFSSSLISFGGLFNRVTKKPQDNTQTELSYTTGSFSLNRLTFDINRPLDASHNTLFRLNGALHTEKSFQDAGFNKNVMLAPSFLFKINDRLNISLDIEAAAFNGTSPIRFAPSTTGKVHNIKDLGLPYKLSFLTNPLDYNTKSVNIYSQINYKLNDDWRLQTNFTRTYSTTEGYVTQLIGKSDSTLQQRAQIENFPYNGVDVQQNLNGEYYIGKMRNRIVIGLDFFNQKSDRSTPTITMPAINFKNITSAYYNFNPAKVDSAATKVSPQVYQTNIYSYSAYVSNVINLTDKLNVMLSVRVDRYKDDGTYYPIRDSSVGAFMQTAFSPKFGVVYEVIKDQLSLFGNYMNGYNNQGGTDFNGNTFKPQQANQWEAGFKFDVFHHRVVSTVSYYNINVTNTLRDDPSNPGYSIQDGTQLSRGFEAEVIANPFGGLNIIGGYTYNYSKYTAGDTSILGLRPATAGPSKMANLWLSYKFLYGSLRGLGLGVGGNYGSKSFQTNTHAFVFEIPSYKTMDATIFYDQPKYRFGIKVDNITNEKYWSFRLAPQNPTRVSINLTLKMH